MSELIEKLGIDWKLLVAQAANFLIVLVVLRLTVYKPLIRILAERRAKIDKGLRDADAASRRLGEVEEIGKAKLAEAERASVATIVRAEGEAKKREAAILAEAKVKESDILKTGEKIAEAKRREAEEAFFNEAQGLVRAAVAKVGNLAPDALDEALIEEAVRAVKKAKV